MKVTAAAKIVENLSDTEGQLALLCGFVEGITHGVEGDTLRKDGVRDLRELLRSLPFYQRWRGEGGIKQ